MGARRAIAALLVLLASPASAGPDPFAACEAQFAKEPNTYEPSLCFFSVTASQQLWDQGRARLQRLRQQNRGVHWPTLGLAYLEYTQGRPEAEALFQAAAEGFRAQSIAKGEVLARLNLGTYLLTRPGRASDAAEQVRRATAVAQASGNAELRARALVGTAQLREQSGADLEGAYRDLRQVESLRGVPASTRNTALHLLGNMAHQLARYDEAIQHYRELERQLRAANQPREVAAALYSIANSMREKRNELPTPVARAEILAAAERALVASIDSGNTLLEAATRALLARLLAADPAQRDAAREHVERCMDQAQKSLQPQRQSECLWVRAQLVADSDPAAAARHMARAIEIAGEGGDRWFVPFAWRYRAKLALRTGPREQAVADGLRLLDVIETFRELQPGGGAGVMSRWAGDYYRVSGELLRGPGAAPPRQDVDLAFLVAERLRARVLLDRISALRASEPEEAGSGERDPIAAERRAALEAISKVHRRLLSPNLPPGARAEALRELDSLEAREAGLRDQLARASHTQPAPRVFARLDEVQALLGDDEALLSFQVGLSRDLFGDFEGGAWLLAVTRGDVRIHAIPDRAELEGMVPVFAGLFPARDGREVAPSAALHERLLSEALRGLPAGVSRLILIPDGRLHQLPFSALRAAPSAEPLGVRYALSVVPSATIWASWRRAPRRPAERSAWVFADPTLAPTRAGAAAERSWLASAAEAPGPLPHAREEGARLVREVGGESALIVGAEASEHALKSGRPGSYAVVHFAAHAVIDDERPERSAVLLAAGADAEDGLLQPREISDLELAGRIVVLSGCRTAAGKVIQGEGVLGLARAFFEAGAVAVVGSLWPLRDDEAEVFFGRFYDHLSEGERLDRALQRAQAEVAAEGAPQAAWAGLVLLGDGSIAPFPGGGRGLPWAWVGLGAIAALAIAAALWLRRARRSRA